MSLVKLCVAREECLSGGLNPIDQNPIHLEECGSGRSATAECVNLQDNTVSH